MTPAPARNLKCESLVEPLGVDTSTPRLSWRVEGSRRGDRPTGYHVLVASAAEPALTGIGDFWDSGPLEAGTLPLVEYQGEPLRSCARYFWRVRWRDGDGILSPWSPVASFVTGFLAAGEWKPRWVSRKDIREFTARGNVTLGEARSPSPQAHAIYLRRDFPAREKAVLALAFVSGLGCCEFRLNGGKVGDRVLDPGWTDYRKRALYSTYDVTGLLRPENAAAVILGNGRHVKDYGYGPPMLACRIEVEYESGDRDIIASDESWRTSHGPLRENGLYFGERYDARLEMPGWDLPGFDASDWTRAVTVQGPPAVSQMMPPVRVTETLKPEKSWSPAPGVRVFDFGRNLSGWVRLSVQGPRDAEVRLRHAELVDEAGGLNVAPNENAEAADLYVLKGGGPEAYEPRFTYHGFRYAELTADPDTVALGDIEARFVHSDVAVSGSFRCSDPLIDRIHRNVLQGQLSNLMSIPTDCPQRDERHGWLGDAHLAAEEAVFNFDMAAFFVKYLEDIRLAVRDDGSLPDVVPPYLPRLYPADPAWSSAYPTILWLCYEHYGDTRLLARHLPYVKRYLDFLGRAAEGHIIRTLGKYGDWCPPGSIVPKKTPVELTSTWYYYHDVLLLGRISRALGRNEEARSCDRLAAEIGAAFNAAFLGEDQYAAHRMSRIDTYPDQTSNALPLFLDMVPLDKKDRVLGNLLRSVARIQDYHVDTGILGTSILLDVLCRGGFAEAAFRVVTRRSYPGWGYMIEEGATTLWERWEKLTGNAMNSHNHIMLGSVDAWFYRTIAGLSPLEPGWKRILVKPTPMGTLTSAEATLETVAGRVRSSWARSEASVWLEATIPAGAEARICVPLPGPESAVLESGKPVFPEAEAAARTLGLVPLGKDGDWAVFDAGSGRFAFEARAGAGPDGL